MVKSQWYKINLSYEQISNGRSNILLDEFGKILLKYKNKDMVLFEAIKKENKTYTYYFSPECFPFAQHLISLFSGKPCVRPSGSEVKLFFGDQNAASSLFHN